MDNTFQRPRVYIVNAINVKIYFGWDNAYTDSSRCFI